MNGELTFPVRLVFFLEIQPYPAPPAGTVMAEGT